MRIKKPKAEVPDGPTPKLKSQYSNAIRRVWQWSKMRRLAVKRATHEDGYVYCELCKEMTPKSFVDHKIPCGDVYSPGYFDRLNVPSKDLQVLCGPCHREKTKSDKKKDIKRAANTVMKEQKAVLKKLKD